MTKIHPTPKVFISYSWDGEEHKAWVRRLAELLVYQGVRVFLDQWDVSPGDSFTSFMEQSISEANFVVLVLTPAYARKSNRREGGVGYEQQIVSGQIAAGIPRRKFLPLLRCGELEMGPSSAVPVHFQGIALLDFREEESFERSFEDLLFAVYSKKRFAPPRFEAAPFQETERGIRQPHEPMDTSDGLSLPSRSSVVSNSDRTALRSALAEAFNLDELRVLAFELGVDWEELQGSSKTDKIIEFILHLKRRRRLDELIVRVNDQRNGLLGGE
jgi:hypothetical protein